MCKTGVLAIFSTHFAVILKQVINADVRKSYVKKFNSIQLEEIKSFLKNKFLCISMYETTDIIGQYIINMIVAVLDHDVEFSKRKFLFHIVELECVNHETIARTFHESVK